MYEYIIYGSYEGISHLPTGAGFGNHPAVSRHLFFLMKKISSRPCGVAIRMPGRGLVYLMMCSNYHYNHVLKTKWLWVRS